MTISLRGVHVLVDDPDAALSFYRDALGLTMRNEVARDGFRWIILVTDGRPETEIPNPGVPATSLYETPRAITSASSRDRTGTTPSAPEAAELCSDT